jgi:hypothetical protein
MVRIIRELWKKLERVKLLFILIVLVFSHYYMYSQGKTAERIVQELRSYEQLQKALTEAEEIRKRDVELMMRSRKVETVVVEKIRTEIVHSECTDVGDEWLQFYNSAIENANSINSND